MDSADLKDRRACCAHVPPVSSSARRWLACALACGAAVSIALGDGEGASPWQRASLPGWTIYSDLPASDTRRLLNELTLLCRDAEALWPVPQGKTAAPDVIVLSGNPPAFDVSFPMANRINGVPYDFREQPRMTLLNFRTTFGGGEYFDYCGGNVLQGRYTKRFLSLLGERVPPWVTEGVGKLIQGMCCGENSIELPALTTDPTLEERVRTNGSEASLRDALGRKAYFPLEELFEASEPAIVRKNVLIRSNGRFLVGPQHKDFWETLPSGTFVDEAYEFAHFCLFAENGRYRAPFVKFVYAACNGPLDEADFKALFGVDYDTLLLAVWRFTDLATEHVYPLTTEGVQPPPIPAVVFQPASDAEISAAQRMWHKARKAPPAPPPSWKGPREPRRD